MGTLWTKFKSQSNERKALSVFIILILISMIAAWYDSPNTPNSNKKYTQAEAIKGTDTPKVDVKVQSGTVKVIPKAIIKKSIKPLPPEIDSDNIEVTDTAEVPPSEAGTKIITTIDTITGDTKIYQKANPIPLFAWESKRRVGVGYGVSTSGPIVKVAAEYGFLRVGNFHLGVQAEIEAGAVRTPEVKAFGLANYSW